MLLYSDNVSETFIYTKKTHYTMRNQDESYIVQIASQIPGVTARIGTPQEDYGYQKADAVLTYKGKDHHVQVSHIPKSKKERIKLLKRGTHPIHTHKFANIALEKSIIRKNIEDILNYQK